MTMRSRMSARRLVPFMPLVPAAATLTLALIGIRGPSFWLDEAATASMTRRSTADMLRVFDDLDLVHAPYYLTMRPWTALFGTGELALRLPSALAMAAAAAGVAVIGRRCHGALAGLLAGLAFAGSTTIIRYAQEARSFAMVTAVAILASYLLVRAAEKDVRRPWAWFGGYFVAVLVGALLNLNAVLLLPAHALTLALTRPKAPGTWLRWTAAAVLAVAALVPFALAAQDQQEQVHWLPAPTWRTVWTLVQFFAGAPEAVVPVLVLAVAGSVAAWRSRESLSLAALAVPWLVLPSTVLLVASLMTDPLFYYRYVLFCAPAMALLVGAGLAWLGSSRHRVAAPALLALAVTLVAVLSVPQHQAIRRQDSRPDDLRAAADIVRRHAQDGDAVVYVAGIVRWDATSYPEVFGRLRDIGQAQDPVSAANLKGHDLLPREIRSSVAASDRVWVWQTRSVVTHPGDVVWRRKQVVQDTGPWRVVGQWRYKGGRLTLYERTGPYQPGPEQRPARRAQP